MPEPRIWILPPEVSERIAAGEVVERPASVVKELVENSLDAGARRITVEIESGGKVLIRVTDDGGGMTADEARLALHRHATSKLRAADDLFNIHTLGFRGEALPSIAAVSEFEILTRTPESPEGTRVVVEGGVIQTVEPAAAQVGTSITVRRLFFNVPVREKFLRSDTTEANQITEWLQRLALSRPGVSFRLSHDGREALLSPGSQAPLNAVVAVLGRKVARDLLPVGDTSRVTHHASPGTNRPEDSTPTHPHTHTPTQVTGFVGRPTMTRANRGQQHFYVNGRSVRSPLLFRALDDAFRATMPSGRYPVAVLFLQVAPDAVDVNVHPAKTEVRFQDESAVAAAVTRAVRAALAADASTYGDAAPPLPEPQEDLPPSPFRVAEPGASTRSPYSPGALPFAESAIGGPQPFEPGSFARDRTRLGDWQGASRIPESGALGPESHAPDAEHSPPTDRSASAGDCDPFAEPAPSENPEMTSDDSRLRTQDPGLRTPRRDELRTQGSGLRALRLLGQAQDLFILAESGGRLWVIDQHVAHERVLFDRMTAPESVREAPQPLLIPATVEVDRTRALALEEHRSLLAELGFEIDPFGPGRYRLRSVPRSLMGRNYETVFRDMADELAEQSEGGRTRLQKEQIAAAAAGRSCKRAVKAGQRLSDGEIERLLADLAASRNPYTCPHGRPVFLTFEEDEIASLFGERTCE